MRAARSGARGVSDGCIQCRRQRGVERTAPQPLLLTLAAQRLERDGAGCEFVAADDQCDPRARAIGPMQFTNRRGNGTYSLVVRRCPAARIDPTSASAASVVTKPSVLPQ